MPHSARPARRAGAGAIDARARVAIRHTRDNAGICEDERPASRISVPFDRVRALATRATRGRAHTARARLRLLATRRAGARSDAARAVAPLRARPSELALCLFPRASI
jgi:hypothetical protein